MVIRLFREHFENDTIVYTQNWQTSIVLIPRVEIVYFFSHFNVTQGPVATHVPDLPFHTDGSHVCHKNSWMSQRSQTVGTCAHWLHLRVLLYDGHDWRDESKLTFLETWLEAQGHLGLRGCTFFAQGCTKKRCFRIKRSLNLINLYF